MKLFKYFSTLSRTSIILFSIVQIILIAMISYIFGKDISIRILYISPLFFIAWYTDLKLGLFFSALATLSKIGIEYLAGRNYSHHFVLLWEVVISLGIFIIITYLIVRLRQTLDLLEEKNKALINANQKTKQFLDIAAHDLKNPLNNIMNYASLIVDYNDLNKDDITNFSRNILASAKRMFNLIHELLMLSYFNSGNTKIQFEAIQLSPIVRNLIEENNIAAEKKNITIHFSTSDENATIFADFELTQKIVENLISNALKFSPTEKNIWIRVKRASNEDGSGKKIYLEVQDEGPGFTEQDKKNIFHEFKRLSASPTGGEESTGLGLSIVKKFVEAMGGNVWCVSEKGKGATFVVTFKPGEL